MDHQQEQSFERWWRQLYRDDEIDATVELPDTNPEIPGLEGQELLLNDTESQTVIFGTVERRAGSFGLAFAGGFLDFRGLDILTIDRVAGIVHIAT